MFDRQSLLFFAMDEGLEVEELQRHVGPPLLVDYMWSKHFSICKNINRDQNSKRDVKSYYKPYPLHPIVFQVCQDRLV
jgi:hypothetical protein